MRNNSKGFTLIEILIALGLAGMILALLVGVFSNFSKSYTCQNISSDLQEGVRSLGEYMAREIRMAGYSQSPDPDIRKRFTNTDPLLGPVILATTEEFRFMADWNNNGVVDAKAAGHDSEIISLQFIPAKHLVQRVSAPGLANKSTQPLLGGGQDGIHIAHCSFTYLDKDEQPTANSKDIRTVILSITGREAAGNNRAINRSFNIRISCRNL